MYEIDSTNAVWTLEPSKNSLKHGWLRAATTTLVNHLRHCNLQTADTAERAKTSHISHGGATSPAGQRRGRQTENPQINAPMVLSQLPYYSLDSPQLCPPPIAGPSNAPGAFMSTTNSASSLASLPPSPALSSLSFSASPHYSSLELSGLPVPESGSPSMFNHPSLSRQQHRILSAPVSRSSSRLSYTDGPLWTSSHQKRFETRIARLTASAGLPLAWVDNPEWHAFVEDFFPAAKSPSRKVLTNRLIPTAVAEFHAEAKAAARGCDATIQSDGWTGVNHHHLIAFMITVDGKVCAYFNIISTLLTHTRQIRTVKVHDASAERKTAEQLLKLLDEVIITVESEWGAVVVAIVTDASGECRKARRQLALKFPNIVVLDCYGHQVSINLPTPVAFLNIS